MASQEEKDEFVKAAMRAELGLGRLEDLHMEDGEGRSSRVYDHPPPLTSSSRPTPANNKWSQAIARGDFNDDDAAQVSGMDTLHDGNLARMRRAARTAYSHVSQSYTESRLSRDRNGLVAPRTRFPGNGRGGRFTPVPGPQHVGDGPIDIEAALSGDARRSAPPAQDSGPPPVTVNLPPGQPSPQASKLQVSFHSTTAAARASSLPVAAQSVSNQDPSPVVQNTQPATKGQTRVILPEGASILLQLPVTVQSTTFTERKPQPGIVFLISGGKPLDDMIVLSIDDESVTDAKYNLSEYTDYMTASKSGLMLVFKVSGGMKLFYAVDFGRAEHMASFIESLRKLVDRPKGDFQCLLTAPGKSYEAPKLPMTTAEIETPIQPQLGVTAETGPPEPTVDMEHSQPAAAITVENTNTSEHVPEVTANKANSVQNALVDIPAIEEAPMICEVLPDVSKTAAIIAAEPQPAAAAGTPQKEYPKETGLTLPVTDSIIENMVKWVMDTARYMRDCSPKEFGFDTMRSVIRATAAAIMTQQYPVFSSMSTQQRLQIVEEQCRPAVERGFLKELSKNPVLVAQLAGCDTSPNDVDQTMTDPQPVAPQQDTKHHIDSSQHPLTRPSSRAYAIDELLSLRATAVEPPHWLPELGFIKEARQHKQPNQCKRSLLHLDESEQPHLPSITGQTRQRSCHVRTPAVTEVLSTNGTNGLSGQTAQPSKIDSATLFPPNSGCSGKSPLASGAVAFGNAASVSSSFDIAEADQQAGHYENLASFLSGKKPDSKKTVPSPPSGLGASRHNSGHVGHRSPRAGGFPSSFGQDSSYTQELVSLFENDDLSQEVAQTTEGLRRLSLHS